MTLIQSDFEKVSSRLFRHVIGDHEFIYLLPAVHDRHHLARDMEHAVIQESGAERFYGPVRDFGEALEIFNEYIEENGL